MYVEKIAYNSLEIAKIISIIAKKCRSDLGAAVAQSLEPAYDLNALQRRHSLLNDIEKYRSVKGELPWVNGLETTEPLIEEAAETGVLTGAELLKIRMLLKLAVDMRGVLSSEIADYPSFSMLSRALRDFSEELGTLSVLDDDGRLYDSASDKLAEVREEMRGLGDTIRRKGHALLNEPSIASMLQERVLALRNGRHAFLVRQDALSRFPGIVVDRSGSGNSVYMEPHSLIVLNNKYSACRSVEMNEELRILRGLTTKVMGRKKFIAEAEQTLGVVDLCYALSEKKRSDKWELPDISPKKMFRLEKARHPLLYDKAVPIDIRCGERFRILVITGPNTGGKTVALKTAGVCVALAWLGFPIPAGEGSVIGDVGELFADIGDEQSIEQNLSTFSAHVTHITKVLGSVTDRSVVLLDELGAGTDPDEGAALGIALLDWLLSKHAVVLATTHYNPIKHYALSTQGIETASVEFDTATLSPTYRILTGIPGKSNALLIASKLGMPREIINRAESAINGREVSMEDLIGELHEKHAALDRESREVDALRKKLDALKGDYETKVSAIKEKRDSLIADADKKAMSIVRNAEDSARALIKNIETADAESSARRELERKRSHFQKIESSVVRREEKKTAMKSVAAGSHKLEPGDTVQLIGTARTATVTEIRGKKALIQAASAQLEVPLTKLSFVKGKEAKPKPQDVQIHVTRPTGVPSSIMVRHMTVDEAIPVVEQYLDRAYCAGYDSVTVIHGRGEGILRREVQELCKRIPYVAEHNLGGPHEGGYGVTVVKFKR